MSRNHTRSKTRPRHGTRRFRGIQSSKLADYDQLLQVKRIGKYKSAGDQLLRRDMSEPQREQLTALLDDIYDNFLSTVAKVCFWVFSYTMMTGELACTC